MTMMQKVQAKASETFLTTEEKVNGINGYVNADYAYLNFPKVMKDNHLNGC